MAASTMLSLPLLVVAALWAPNAHANDSASEFGIGGLVMVKTDAITMQREDLTITPLWIKVRYEFRNDGTEPVTLRVAFPLPEVPVDAPFGRSIEGTKVSMPSYIVPATNEVVGGYSLPNFIKFEVAAHGKRLEPEVEVRAELPGGKDITRTLRDIGGWQLVLQPREFTNLGDTRVVNDDIGPTQFRQLLDLGAIGPRWDSESYALWNTRITYHWMQTFRPGVTVVEHRYQPITGYFGFPQGGKQWEGGPYVDEMRGYCVDDASWESLSKITARPESNGYLSALTLAYVLTTGANWAGPIGTFHLTIDGYPSPPVWGPMQFAIACADLPLIRTGPARLEATARNYVPTRDLRILMIAK